MLLLISRYSAQLILMRRLLNPNALPPSESRDWYAQIRQVLVDLWTITSPFTEKVEGDHTTTGAVAIEKLRCLNSEPITIFLNSNPVDGEGVQIKRWDGPVTIDGQGKLIDGEATLSLNLYDAPHLEYSEDVGQWGII